MVPCAKSRDQLKQFEDDKEDCFIIEFDPDEAELEFSKLSLTHTSDADLTVVAQKGKIACRDYPHPRHHCAKFPFGKTPDESHCDQCYCYVCDFAAPCKKWAGKSKHCKAFDTDWWKIKRQLRRESVERKKEAFKDFEHPRHMCVKYPFEQTPHDTHCELCRCYVCGSAAPCKEWVGTSGHCHAFNNQKWRTKRELKGQAELQKEQSEPGSGVSITAGKQVQSNVVLQEDQPQEAQRSQTDLGGSVGGESTGDLSDESQVYVENLPHDMTTHNLASLFEEVGVVKKAKVVISWKNKFGVVTMGSKVEAEKAVAMFNGYTLKGNVLIVRVREVNRKRTYTADCSCSLFTGYTAQVYVDNLPHDVTRQDLASLFEEVGVVKKAELKYSNDTSRVGLVTPGRNYTSQVGLVTPGRNYTSQVGLVTGGRNDTSRVNDMSQVGLVTGGRRVGLVTPGRNDTSRVGLVTSGRNDTSRVGLVTPGRKIIALVTMGSILEAEKAVAMFNRNTLKGNVLCVRQVNRSGGLLFPKRTYTADGFYSIYIGNLSQKVDNQRLEGLFIDHDFKPVNARIILDRLTKQSRGFGFVVVESSAERDDAVLTLDGYILDGRLLKLREANY